MTKTQKNRGENFSSNFFSDLKASSFVQNLYQLHSNELLFGIRNSYVNLYYNCDSIAKITKNRNGQLQAELSDYYLTGKKSKCQLKLSIDDVCGKYSIITYNSEKKSTPEKKAQQALVVGNNSNPKSKWFCFDVEYKKSYANIDERKNNFSGRFDIIAISKKAPHQIAFIELKYGSGAIGGTSGIRKHISDFYTFSNVDKTGNSYFAQFKKEAISILLALTKIGVDVPKELQLIQEQDIDNKPLFAIITLNNNLDEKKHTPKMTMGAYLFNDYRWGKNRISSALKKGDYYDLIKHDKSFQPIFLFGKQTLPNLNIFDILDEKYYDKEIIPL